MASEQKLGFLLCSLVDGDSVGVCDRHQMLRRHQVSGDLQVVIQVLLAAELVCLVCAHAVQFLLRCIHGSMFRVLHLVLHPGFIFSVIHVACGMASVVSCSCGQQFIFQQDGVPAQAAKVTQQWLAYHCPDFIDKNSWP